ncbi:hypothetical protein MKZ25_03160 [Solibacillus sp. FSL W7-1464]|uniref:hypothetical protein n=1 Tax=Solibacillus sp. FSL W7-1464 TaxID=2921706 RepID=UPI0030FA88C0
MEWEKETIVEIYRTTIDYLLLPETSVKPCESKFKSIEITKLVETAGTIAQDQPLPILVHLSSENSNETKIIWSSEGDGKREYHIWPAKFNVPKNKAWKITFALPYDPRMDGQNNIYVLDSMGNELAQSFYYSGDERTTTLTIKPDLDYIPGESYTLYIKNILGGNGEVLGRFTKMDFTVKLGTKS